ncbi:hypothetical protein AVEN_213485-1 [Araneus ventricosus]|uniref:Mariner Mos1 transposase n=1 Tax=Araneus ventricosus TaxID=182803 RepID=A0A4Y1ZJM3_ARAVE|nr:hypothetical protein AVEN_213485-1 [Araneus ventricosus]
MTLGLGAPPLPPQMKMLSAFEKSCVRTDELTIDAIASELGISHGSVHSILHDDLNIIVFVCTWFQKCYHLNKKNGARHSVTTLEYPPYSPDLAPAEFYLFPRLKMKLKGRRFVDSDEVIENETKQLKDLSKNGFLECFEQLYERWKKCVDAGGKYFEGQ